MQFDTLIDQIKSQTAKTERLQKQNTIIINQIEHIEQMIYLFLDDNDVISPLNQRTTQRKTKKKNQESSKTNNTEKKQNSRKKEIKKKDEYATDEIRKIQKHERKQMKKMETEKFINHVQILKEKRAKAKTEEEINEINKEIESFEFSTKKELKSIHKRDTHPFQICYQGEGYVYEHLLSFSCFKKVEWNVMSNDSNCPSITLNNNHKYFIDEKGEHFDIYAEDYNGQKYYFEVKTTTHARRSANITQCQTKYGHYIELKNGIYIIVTVSNVFTSPSIEYHLFIPGIDISENKIEIDNGNEENFLQKISEVKSKNIN